MNDEQIKLMTRIAKEVDDLNVRVSALESAVKSDKADVVSPFAKTLRNIITNVDHKAGEKVFNFNVSFAADETATSESRRTVTVSFLRELEGLFDKFKVTKMRGEFENHIHGTI